MGRRQLNYSLVLSAEGEEEAKEKEEAGARGPQ